MFTAFYLLFFVDRRNPAVDCITLNVWDWKNSSLIKIITQRTPIMRNLFREKFRNYTENRIRSGHRRGIYTVAACLVVFITVYTMTLPAATMEHYTCGFEEHQHSIDCYTDDVLTCGMAEHRHTDDCRDGKTEASAVIHLKGEETESLAAVYNEAGDAYADLSVNDSVRAEIFTTSADEDDASAVSEDEARPSVFGFSETDINPPAELGRLTDVGNGAWSKK